MKIENQIKNLALPGVPEIQGGRLFILSVLFLLCSPFISRGVEITFQASSKSSVAVGEQFQVSFTLNSTGSGFKPPTFPGFQVLSGPTQSMSTQIINNSVSQSLTISYVLSAAKEGVFTISPARIKVNGTEIESNSLKITVVKGTASQQGASSGSDGQTFLRISFSKTKAYRGEAIVVTHKIYSKQGIVGFEDIKFPSYDGFWSEDIQQPQQITLNRETYNGEVYSTGVLKQSILYAQKAGKIEIEPFAVDVVIREQTRGGWDPFFNSYRDIKKALKTSPASLEILPFPLSGQPADFSGITGDFTMKAEITKTEVESNEAVNLKITISGNGNLKEISAPALEFPPDIESYDPKTVDNIKSGLSGMSGSRTFDYLLIPRHAGEFKVGPFSFSYFDAGKGKYVELKQPEFTLKVGKGSGEEDKATGVAITSKEDLKVLGSDIRYIKTNEPDFIEKGRYFFRSPMFYALSGLPVLFYVGFFLWHRNMVKHSGNVALMKSRRANKIAGKRLALAKKFLQEKKVNEYYEEIFKALWGYISDKLSIPVAELTKEKIRETMIAKSVGEETVNEFISLLDKAEYARFAPAGGEKEMDTIYTESVNVISKIESNV